MRSGFSVTVKLFIPADSANPESVKAAAEISQMLTTYSGIEKISSAIEIVGQPTIKFVNQRE